MYTDAILIAVIIAVFLYTRRRSQHLHKNQPAHITFTWNGIEMNKLRKEN